MIKIGTSGFNYDDWRTFFYPVDLPKKDFLQYYSNYFDALELDFTYYTMPSSSQLESILSKTGGNVEFAIKAHQSMTHQRIASKQDIANFNEALKPIRQAEKLGAVLLQFPHSFCQNEENRSYVKKLVDAIGNSCVVEFRTKQWSSDQIINWLSKINVGYCCVDEPQIKGLMPPLAVSTASTAYVRFNGRNAEKWYQHNQAHERYDYKYNVYELKQWASKIKILDKQATKTLVFFNNHFQAKSVYAAKMLKTLLQDKQGIMQNRY